MIKEERVLKNFLKHIQIDSPTKYELDYANFLMEELKRLGFQVEMDDSGSKVGSNAGNLLARLKGNADKEPILFSAHMDTVSPGRGIVPVIKDGIIYSEGDTILASDDKAGVVAILEGVESILESGKEYGDIEIAFSIFEEGGLHGIKLMDHSRFKSKQVYVLDSGGSPGEIIIAGPAQNKLEIKFIGKTAHAGVAPEEGISAIQMAAEAISKMELLRVDEETTANIGVIKGGIATNIVTEFVDVIGEVRSLDSKKIEEHTNHIIKCCKDSAKKFGGKVEINVENAYGSFKIDKNSSIVENVKKACDILGLEAYTDVSGGGSDTNIWNKSGFEAVNLGVGMKKPHTTDEYIAIKDLENAARLVYKLIEIQK